MMLLEKTKKTPEMIDLNGKGILFTIRQLADLYGLRASTLRSRLRSGWSHARALRTPPIRPMGETGRPLLKGRAVRRRDRRAALGTN